MTNIDASLRRPILPDNRGSQVPDSKPLLANTPQLIMSPGVSRPVYKFDDGDGLTDAFGNVYDGYGTGGISTSTVSSSPDTVDDEIDTTSDDLDILQYNASREKYESKSFEEANIGTFEVGQEADLDLPQYNAANEQYEPRSLDQIGLAKFGGSTPQNGEIPYWNDTNQQYEPAPPPSGGTPAPFDIDDFISGIIEAPQDRTYRIVQSLPYSITITNTTSSVVTGGTNPSFPSGTIAAGNPIDITLSSTTAGAEFFRFQIDFTRTLTP